MGKEVAEGWKISVQVVVGREVFKQQAGSEGRCCGVGEQSGPPGHQSRTGGCLGWFLMFQVPLANMFATFSHLPCQQAMYTRMVLNKIAFCCFPTPYRGCLRVSRFDSTPLLAGGSKRPPTVSRAHQTKCIMFSSIASAPNGIANRCAGIYHSSLGVIMNTHERLQGIVCKSFVSCKHECFVPR